jgi:hypothetical protein
VDIALHAFMLARSTTKAPIRLTIKTIRPCRAYLPSSLHAALMGPDVRVIEGFVGREVLNDLHRGADAVLYPSRWDGFGFALLEALHAGVPVLATDGYPMNELVRDDHTGLLIPARQVGWTRLAPHWEPEVERLADAMRRIADDFELRRRLTCADAGALIDRQETFRRAVRGRLLSDARASREEPYEPHDHAAFVGAWGRAAHITLAPPRRGPPRTRGRGAPSLHLYRALERHGTRAGEIRARIEEGVERRLGAEEAHQRGGVRSMIDEASGRRSGCADGQYCAAVRTKAPWAPLLTGLVPVARRPFRPPCRCSSRAWRDSRIPMYRPRSGSSRRTPAAG